MELYLRWLAKNEQQPGEAPPLGLILCAGKKREQIELLELGASGIHVAEYLTGLPDRRLLEEKLHAAIELSKALRNQRKRGPRMNLAKRQDPPRFSVSSVSAAA